MKSWVWRELLQRGQARQSKNPPKKQACGVIGARQAGWLLASLRAGIGWRNSGLID
jgi:hypothetical protein